MSEQLRNGLSIDATGVYPMCGALARALADPIIRSMLQPLTKQSERTYPALAKESHHQRSARDQPYYPHQDTGKGRGRAQGKGRGHGGGKGDWKGKSKGSPSMPGGLRGHSRTEDNKSICYGFNLGTCSDTSCQRGLHMLPVLFQRPQLPVMPQEGLTLARHTTEASRPSLDC